ncbi:MAG TPA: DUF4337 family protein [Candidatus Acidoferrum sp.]|jgi:hypothetical protein|nr:DUF4337 family protein [Candidatus Acidoferrum sp.]
MKVTVPQELKADMPQTVFGKILSATPVVMAVVATMLAGLASSEMTKAQYDRSLGAQQQSKAGDQWSFFQAKRLRGAVQQNSVDLLESLTALRPLDPAALRTAAEQWPAAVSPTEAAKLKAELAAVAESAAGQQALTLLREGKVPGTTEGAPLDARVKAALDAMENLKPDAEMASLLAQVDNKLIEDSLGAARDRTQEFDLATKPVNQAIDQIDSLLARRTALLQQTQGQAAADVGASPAAASLSRDFTVARLRYAALRYEVEARLNQVIANLYELQVRKSNISAERHHARSQRFFFGMLAAQFGVIISTFALAARNRNLLWSLAAGAGLLAVAFAVYVYLYV